MNNLRHEPTLAQSAHEFYQDSSRLPPVFSDLFCRIFVFYFFIPNNYVVQSGEYFISLAFHLERTVVYLDTAKGGNCRYPHILEIIAPYISERKGV